MSEQQRVAIVRALVQEPEIILADEPVSSLDPRNARLVMDTLLRINKHFGLTILCNLHSLDLARTYCDRVIGMAAGQIETVGRSFTQPLVPTGPGGSLFVTALWRARAMRSTGARAAAISTCFPTASSKSARTTSLA